jgi:hypothetical protein
MNHAKDGLQPQYHAVTCTILAFSLPAETALRLLSEKDSFSGRPNNDERASSQSRYRSEVLSLEIVTDRLQFDVAA